MAIRSRFVAVALAMLVVALAAPGVAVAATTADWTVGVYVNGDNNLEKYWDQYSLAWLLEVPASSSVNIVAMRDRLSTIGTDLVEIAGGAETVVGSFPEKDFGDGETLAWFLETVSSRYPSTHLAVIIWDHGYGWRYFSTDDSSGGDRITMDEFREAIVAADVPIDVLGFDCCNMADVDVAYEAALTGHIGIMVASEESVPANGYPYDKMLTPLAEDPSRTPEELAGDMVAGWKEYYDAEKWANTAHLAAIDVVRVGEATADLQRWTELLQADLPRYRKAYARAVARSWTAWGSSLVDLGDFCGMLGASASVTDATLKTATQTVADDLSDALIAQDTAPSSADATGLTIWWGVKHEWKKAQAAYVGNVAFAQRSPTGVGWWSFLSAYNSR